MSFSRPIQLYHSHADLLWPDGTEGFETAGNETATIFYQNLLKTAIVGGFLADAEASLVCSE
jgi:hypothetical protein